MSTFKPGDRVQIASLDHMPYPYVDLGTYGTVVEPESNPLTDSLRVEFDDGLRQWVNPRNIA